MDIVLVFIRNGHLYSYDDDNDDEDLVIEWDRGDCSLPREALPLEPSTRKTHDKQIYVTEVTEQWTYLEHSNKVTEHTET